MKPSSLESHFLNSMTNAFCSVLDKVAVEVLGPPECRVEEVAFVVSDDDDKGLL